MKADKFCRNIPLLLELSMSEDKVLFEIKNSVGIIILNSPKSLNSLDTQMCKSIHDKMIAWADDLDIKVVLLKSSSDKAFCAGGDVVSLYKSMVSNDDYHKDFFRHEYKLDLLIHEYKKPVIALMHGIVMGGGIGISNGAKFRVATERTKFAMPEITIGLFPDVGGSYFLNRMPGKLGLFLGLTGSRFNATDALYTQMADYFITSDKLEALEDNLLSFEFTDDHYKDVTEVIEHFAHDSNHGKPQGQLESRFDIINQLCEGESILIVDKKLRNYAGEDELISRAVKTYLNGSPLSAAIIFDQIKRGKDQTIQEVFDVEGKMALNFGASKDFPEGVRALLIEKDNNPNWEFKTLEEVSQDKVDSYFK